MTPQLFTGAVCVGLTVLSGVGDTYGFVHAAALWNGGAIVGSELARSAAGFGVGIGSYWLVVRYLEALGVQSTTLQTLGWFAVTIVGVAVVSGDIAGWSLINKIIAVAIVVGIAWLLVDVSTA
jgi:hypothetical protein